MSEFFNNEPLGTPMASIPFSRNNRQALEAIGAPATCDYRRSPILLEQDAIKVSGTLDQVKF